MKISAYTIISRDLALLDWCLSNATKRAGVEIDEWVVVGWGCTEEVKAYCQKEGVRLVEHTPTLKSDHVSHSAWFLHNLYACWNLGYQAALHDWVVRMGSDQFFSRDWLLSLKSAAERFGEKGIYHCWTCESDIAKNSRHDVRPFGTTPDTFDERAWDVYANDIRSRYSEQVALQRFECDLWYRHPVKGMELRPDGCTWFQHKDLWREYGPMSDSLVPPGIAGDVDYMDRLMASGVNSYLVPRSLTYHLVQGESRPTEEGKGQGE